MSTRDQQDRKAKYMRSLSTFLAGAVAGAVLMGALLGYEPSDAFSKIVEKSPELTQKAQEIFSELKPDP